MTWAWIIVVDKGGIFGFLLCQLQQNCGVGFKHHFYIIDIIIISALKNILLSSILLPYFIG